MTARMISNARMHVTASCRAATAAEILAGCVDRLKMDSSISITVLAAFPVDDYSRPVPTPAINHAILTLPVLPAIGPARCVADIADAPRRVAIHVPLAQSNVDGVVLTAAIAAICRARSRVI